MQRVFYEKGNLHKMEDMTNVIEMRHIVKDFNGFKANNDINLTLKKGEILALLGENGAGKSTLMSILSGLIQPTSGTIEVRGKKVNIKNLFKFCVDWLKRVNQLF